MYSALQTPLLVYTVSGMGKANFHHDITTRNLESNQASDLCFFNFFGESSSTLRFFPLDSFGLGGLSLDGDAAALVLAGLSRMVSTLSIDASSDRVCVDRAPYGTNACLSTSLGYDTRGGFR